MVETAAASSKLNDKWWAPIVEFGVHTIVGTVIFLVITAPALLLAYLHAHLAFDDKAVELSFRIGEYALLFADLALFLLFLGRTTIRIGKKLW